VDLVNSTKHTQKKPS